MLNKNRITGKIAVNYRRGTGMQITVIKIIDDENLKKKTI
jgi:hypothetical protein